MKEFFYILSFHQVLIYVKEDLLIKSYLLFLTTMNPIFGSPNPIYNEFSVLLKTDQINTASIFIFIDFISERNLYYYFVKYRKKSYVYLEFIYVIS